MSCPHTTLTLTPSPFGPLAGYQQPSPEKLIAAERKSGRAAKSDIQSFSSKRPITLFPAPLVLPHDDLNYDPEYPPQSVKSWTQEKERNRLNLDEGRTTLYVVHVPIIGEEVDFMSDWAVPNVDHETVREHGEMVADANLFAEYLRAFYHGMNVVVLPTRLSWTTRGKSKTKAKPRSASSSKDAKKASTTLPKHIGLAYNDQCIRIRVRSPPDNSFPAQLNLDDILDAAIDMLPQDAYAMCLLVNHDLYESADDDFCCGRAYGGSRVAVVQSARYNPSLDSKEKIDRSHMWPLSHCKTFVDALCEVEDVSSSAPTKLEIANSKQGPMREAVNAAAATEAAVRQNHGNSSSEQQDIQALWFSRLARTVSHELGHCFGMDHCVYYACNMQGTAGMREDVRQPPYLCAVCEAKIGYGISGELQVGGDVERQAWIRQRCEALIAFCARLDGAQLSTPMWRGLEAWLRERIAGM